MAGPAAPVVALKGIVTSASTHLDTIPRLLPKGTFRSTRPNEVSIVSYNALCQRFATPSRFQHVPPAYLSRAHRWPLLQRELSELDADIVCLQESPIDNWEELNDFMSERGYGAIQQLKPHEVKLALFWRESRLELAWWEERSRALLAELRLLRRGERLEGKDAANASETGQHTLYLANVHLEARPDRAADRVAQLRHGLHRLVHHIETRAPTEPLEMANVVVAGDFNSTEREAPCEFLRRGNLPINYSDGHGVATTKDDTHHPFDFRDVYAAAHAAPPFTRRVDGQGARLDFLWCTSRLGLSAVLRPLPQDLELERMVVECGLPNKEMPSDHLPVGAVLELQCAAATDPSC